MMQMKSVWFSGFLFSKILLKNNRIRSIPGNNNIYNTTSSVKSMIHYYKILMNKYPIKNASNKEPLSPKNALFLKFK